MSSTMALGQTVTLLDLFQPAARIINRCTEVAREKAAELSHSFRSSFEMASIEDRVIKPVFNAFASGVRAVMNKIVIRGKGGQEPWAQGPYYENVQKIIGMIRKERRAAPS